MYDPKKNINSSFPDQSNVKTENWCDDTNKKGANYIVLIRD